MLNRRVNPSSHALDPAGVTEAPGRMILTEMKVRSPSQRSDAHRLQAVAMSQERLIQSDVPRGNNRVEDDKRTCELKPPLASQNSLPKRLSTNRTLWKRKTSIAMTHREETHLVPHAAEVNASQGQSEDRDRNERHVTIGLHVLKPREEPSEHLGHLAKTVLIEKQSASALSGSLAPRELLGLLAPKASRVKRDRKTQTPSDQADQNEATGQNEVTDQNEATGHRGQIDPSERLVRMFRTEVNALPALRVYAAKELPDPIDLLEAKLVIDLLAVTDRNVRPRHELIALTEMLHLRDAPRPPALPRKQVASELVFMTTTALLS